MHSRDRTSAEITPEIIVLYTKWLQSEDNLFFLNNECNCDVKLWHSPADGRKRQLNSD